MKKIRVASCYILIFTASLIYLLGFLFASSQVPQYLIQKRMEESADKSAFQLLRMLL